MMTMLAAILESGEPGRLHTGLSLLVCTAVEDEPARGLVSFGALGPLVSGELGGDPTLEALWATARELPGLRLWACTAAVDAAGTDRAAVDAVLDGVMSTPRFLAETAGARLVVV